MLTERPRFPDPLLASVIFAPVAQNETLSSVTASEGVTEAFTLGWIMEQNKEKVRRLSASRWPDAEEFKRFLLAFCSQWETVATPGFAARSALGAMIREQVPPRAFPFATHFNFGTLPVVEGAAFDVDDFVEH